VNFLIERRDAPCEHPFSHIKKRGRIRCVPLFFLLPEVPLQQTRERLAVTGFVRGFSPSGLHLAGGASTLKRFDIAGF